MSALEEPSPLTDQRGSMRRSISLMLAAATLAACCVALGNYRTAMLLMIAWPIFGVVREQSRDGYGIASAIGWGMGAGLFASIVAVLQFFIFPVFAGFGAICGLSIGLFLALVWTVTKHRWTLARLITPGTLLPILLVPTFVGIAKPALDLLGYTSPHACFPQVVLQPLFSRGAQAIGFSADGSLLAIGSGDASLTCYSVTQGRELMHVRAVDDPISALAFSPVADVVAVGSGSGKISLWNVRSGKQLATLGRPADLREFDKVSSLSFSPSGTLLISGDQSLRLWDTATGREVMTRSGLGANSLAWSPDGQTIAVADWRQHVTLIDGRTLKDIAVFQSGREQARAVGFSSDGRLLAAGLGAGGGPGQIIVWDLKTRAQRYENVVSPGGARYVSFLGESKDVLVAPYGDSKIEIWDILTKQRTRVLVGLIFPVNAVAVSRNGEYVAASDGEGKLVLWHLVGQGP